VSTAIVVFQALIAALAAIMLWPKSPPHLKKTLIVSIASLWVLVAVLQSIHDKQVAKERHKAEATQTQTANAVSLLEGIAESEQKAKETETRRHQARRHKLDMLISRGFDLRGKCEGIAPPRGEQRWMAEVRRYLSSLNRDDAMEFVHSSELLPGQACFARIQGHLSVLGRIRDRIPED